MGNFHRFVDPTYPLFGGESFPAVPGGTGTIGLHTYDRVNVVSGGIGAGNSANADGQKASGVNQFTYFVSFGEDATSADANRGFRAAFQNMDVLDDLLRAPLPRVATQTGASPSANGIQITGTVFCGHSVSQPASELVAAAANPSLNPLYNGTTFVVPTDIDDGTPGNSVIGTGWVVNPTVRFNTSVVQSYILYFGVRTNYARRAEVEQGVWWDLDMLAWARALWNKRIFTHGLNEMYRRSTYLTSSNPALDTGGSGAVITRDGQAITMNLPWADFQSAAYPDPWLAAHKVQHEAFNFTTYSAGYGGDIGFLSFASARDTTSDVAELSGRGPLGAAQATYIPRSVNSNTIGTTTRTRIPAGSAATLNPGGAGAAVVELASPNYFINSNGQSAIYEDVDVLLVNFGGGVVRAYYIELDPVNPNRAILHVPSGATASFTTNTNVTVTWYSALFMSGGTKRSVLEYYQPIPLGEAGQYRTYDFGGVHLTGGFGDYDVLLTDAQPLLSCYGLDPADPTNRIRTMGLYGVGHIITQWEANGYAALSAGGHGHVLHAFTHRTGYEGAGSSGDTLHIDPQHKTAAIGTEGAGLGAISYATQGTAGAPFTLNIVSSTSCALGATFELFIDNFNGVDLTINWDANFAFSDATDAQPGGDNMVSGAVSRWRGVFMRSTSNGRFWFMERLPSYFVP